MPSCLINSSTISLWPSDAARINAALLHIFHQFLYIFHKIQRDVIYVLHKIQCILIYVSFLRTDIGHETHQNYQHIFIQTNSAPIGSGVLFS